ncbi:DinB family protein [Novipirellula sp. SH528]|uniref:DinB family protein n=1 Tax=Novipirellula sp. SH528 TaxID=3454466 RepID=UPI003FA03B36
MLRHPICVVLLLLTCQSTQANQDDPIAVRTWPGGIVSLETHWGLRLGVETTDALVDHKTPAAWDQTISTSAAYDHVLLREPNAASSSWLPISDAKTDDPNQVRVQSAAKGVITITVDGVVIVVVDSDAKVKNTDGVDQVDVLVVQTAADSSLSRESFAQIVRQWRPRFVIPLGHVTADEAVRNFQETAGANDKIINQTHNTFAVSRSASKTSQPQIVVLSDSAWSMPAELATEFDKMEGVCSESQKVFAKLSAEQMNFRPANGTHTPRWNAEHMMGRQLLFFSQIYHAIDPAIPTLDLNPKQMPPDYVFAHPDWDGAEEARQMQRVSDFTRRYAYLLDGVELDSKAPGSRWPTLRALLKQMQHHYGEHTANTEKKFDLPGFPKS